MKFCNATAEKVKDLDKFGQAFQFRLGTSGKTEAKSCCGAMLSIIMSVVMLVYGGYKFNFLIERKGASIV